jgi:hypothetical protein
VLQSRRTFLVSSFGSARDKAELLDVSAKTGRRVAPRLPPLRLALSRHMSTASVRADVSAGPWAALGAVLWAGPGPAHP